MTTPEPSRPDGASGPPLTPDEEAQKLVGQVLSERYRVDAVLGAGGMGAVYRAEHLLMHKRVAIKVLHREMTLLPEAVQRFEREAMAAGHIEHPNVATAYDFGKLANGSFFLVLEFVEGVSLRERLEREGALPVERAVHITRQILQGLVRAHGLSIVHRDLKPENVMLVDRDGDPDFVKVLDFGIAKVPVGEMTEQNPARPAATTALTQLGMVYGTPEYMAPEQALGQDVDLRADLYALGVMFFEMLSGRRPFNAASPVQILGMVISQPVPKFAEICPDKVIPPPIEEVVRTLLAKVPDERYPDARAALSAIDGSYPPVPMSRLGGSDAWARPGSLPTSSQPSLSREPVAVGGGASPSVLGAPLQQTTGALTGPHGLDRRVLIGAAAGAGAVALLVSLAMVFRDPTPAPGLVASASVSVSASAEPPPPPPPSVTEEEIQAAAGKGVEALEALKAKAPRDPRLLRALGKAQAEGKQGAAALATLGELIEVDESAALDRAVRAAVVQIALSEKKPDATLAFAESKMGAGGPDVLYELSNHLKAPPPLKKRAADLLSKVSDKASPALKVTLGVRKIANAGKKGVCGQAPALKQLLADAKEHGDSRVLPYLGPMTDPKSCGNWMFKADCYPCLRSDNALNEAISAVKSRENKLSSAAVTVALVGAVYSAAQ